MGKLNKNKKGFGAIELFIVIIVVIVLGLAGWLVYKNHNKAMTTKGATVTKTVPKTTPEASSTTASSASNPYAGWKTYHSILNSGLSFEYPANWVFTPPSKPFKNNNGGVESESYLTSAAIQTKPSGGSNVATNQYMCVTFDEYGGSWSYGDTNLSSPSIIDDNFQVNNTKLTLGTYQGASPMLDTLILTSTPPSSVGNTYIDTKNNYVVEVSARFNCGQGGQPGITNLNADFNSQPETAIAKLIIESIKF